ncbi:A-kinase anchor protein 10, mitochondrial [Anabrus simplex]|uniref:A-kinase anchor protein 10, mitochondrial n=1 Tax=Anabrus simplex TaxID=316456 RepID=UPI0035A36767
MLQFWKKSGPKEKGDKTRSNSSSPAKSPVGTSTSNGDISEGACGGMVTSQLGPLAGHSDGGLAFGDLGEYDASPSGSQKVMSRSRLSQTLSEILADKGALAYFIQYLDAKDAVALVKFWLDVESFRSASRAKVRNDDAGGKVVCQTVTREQLESACSCPSLPCTSQLEQDKISLGTDCDSTVGDSSSVFESPLHSCGSANDNYYNPLYPKNNNDANLPSQTVPHFSRSCVLTLPTFPAAVSISHPPLETEHPPPVSLPEKERANVDCEVKCKRTESHESRVLPKIGADSTIKDSIPECTLKVDYVSEHACGRNSSASTCDESSVSPTRASKLLQATLTDAVRIFKKYLAHGAPYHIEVPHDVWDRCMEAICRRDGLIDSECFTECQAIVFHTMETKYFQEFRQSEFYCKHQIDILTSGNVALSDILYNESALFYFMEYMEQEGNQSLSLLEFWISAENFQQHLMDKKGTYDPLVAQNDAIVIYDKYFSLQATNPLGFNDMIRFEIEHNICREEGPLPDCFARPIRLVLRFLDKNYLPSFLTSQLYFRYLSELINTMQSSAGLVPRKRKSGSECSSEMNISVHNTLLAMEDTSCPPRKIIRNVDDREMSIDSRQLYDPDSLWKRRHPSDLSFGRVNEMGRFETDVEPEPDKKGESRLSKVVKKLVNKDEDKAEEEMAWQIAEMIVKEITRLTIGPEDEAT